MLTAKIHLDYIKLFSSNTLLVTYTVRNSSLIYLDHGTIAYKLIDSVWIKDSTRSDYSHRFVNSLSEEKVTYMLITNDMISTLIKDTRHAYQS